ncbi:MAG: hypothetical protein M0038_18090 [Pseudomonadota bacterium]|nr:hypothetical protein [Pseudomonadota bacterium]
MCRNTGAARAADISDVLVLLVMCWPAAILAWVLWPLVVPLRLGGVVFEGLFKILRPLVLFPVRILSGRV